MATRKVLVLNPTTGELQQLQSGDTVFGLYSSDIAATQAYVTSAVGAEATARNTAISDAIASEVTARNAAITSAVAAEALIRATNDGDLSTLTTTAKTDLVSAINEVKSLAGTGVSGLQTEVNAIETAVGLNGDGTLVAYTGTNYINTAATLVAADGLLDAAIKTVADGLASEITARGAADTALQGSITTINNTLGTLDGLYVNVAGDTMTGNLAFGGTKTVTGLASPVNGDDAATKNYVDNLVSGLTWKAPVDSAANTNPVPTALADGYRHLNLTNGKIYTVTTGAFDAGVTPSGEWAVFNKADEMGFVYDTNAAAWVQFTGAGQIDAGVGLTRAGNTLNINLGAGIAQLPTDEVGLDIRSDSALFLTEDGTTASTGADAKLALKTGSALEQTGGVLQVATGGITNDMLAHSTLTINGSTGSDIIELGDTFAIMGNNPQGIVTTVDSDTNTLTVAGINASSTQKGVASFNTGDFSVTAGAVALADVGTAGTYGSATSIPVITTDAKGRVTTVTTATIDTGASATAVTTTGATVGNAVYVSGDGVTTKAIATGLEGAANVRVAGIVSADGRIVTAGVVNGLSGLTPGARYFLSDANAGKLVSTAPTAAGSWVAPVGIAVTATSLAIQIGMPVQL